MNLESTPSPGNQLDLPATLRPPQIRASHLEKLAIVYARQSTTFQVREHTGSTAAQLELADLPRQWGWPASRILVIDDDLGLSGTSAQNRPGFQKMLDLMDRGEVGLIVVRDHSRLSRDPHDAATFVKKLVDHSVLLHAGGHLFDGATEDLAQLFGLHLQSLLSWFENRTRTHTMRSARRAKARQGHAVTLPPIGYVKSGPGKWIKDPDPRIQEAIRRIFHLYRDTGSIGNVFRYMRGHKLLFPRRRHGEVLWQTPSRSQIANVLSNPNYAGDYVFQRTKWVKASGNRRARLVKRPQSEWIPFPAHHEAYVSQEEWRAIQAALASRRPTVRPPVGRGPALLQGLLWCGTCERSLHTRYSARAGSTSYICLKKDRQEVTHIHLGFGSKLVDACIVRGVLNALRPLELQAALEAIEDHRTEQTAIAKLQRHHLQQAQDDVDELRRRYRFVDPSNERVRADLEAALETALARLDVLKHENAEARAVAPPALRAEDARDLVAFGEHIETLWGAPTTTNQDRKRILRLVISRVTVLHMTDDAIELEIVWAAGFQERCRVLRLAGADALVRAMRKTGQTAAQIAAELNARGVTSLHGTPMSETSVLAKLERLGIKSQPARREVLVKIRSLLIDGKTRREILDIVNRELPLHLKRWTPSRLVVAITALRTGVPGVPRLPWNLSEAPDWDEVRNRIRQRRDAGHTFASIAQELNASGFHPRRAARFSAHQVAKLLKSRKGQAQTISDKHKGCLPKAHR
jgi:DNA invertase Pin-like site-specific DNA recombinase